MISLFRVKENLYYRNQRIHYVYEINLKPFNYLIQIVNIKTLFSADFTKKFASIGRLSEEEPFFFTPTPCDAAFYTLSRRDRCMTNFLVYYSLDFTVLLF